MALFPKETLAIKGKGLELITGDRYGNSGSFRISLVALSPDVQVKVSRYSSILNSPDIRDRITLIGIDTPFTMDYGDKIWVEIYYDRNLSPIFAIINSGPKWTNKVAGANGDIPVYPSELEFISKKDLTQKIAELSDLTNQLTTIKKNASDEITSQYNSGFLTDEQHQSEQDALNEAFSSVNDTLVKYRQDMNQFFISLPSANFKKLFKTYSLIGYTTKNLDPSLDGIIVRPENQGQAAQGGVNISSEDSAFKIVQALNTDLLLADICFQNKYPARLPIPYHRPVYYYVHNGQDEELATTQ